MKKKLKKILPPKTFFFLKEKLKSDFDEILVINKFLKNTKGIMFDVGSLDGSSFMPFLLKGWQVYAFEPDNTNYQVISEYLKKWNLKATLTKKAVSNTNETQMFYTSISSRGIPSLLKFNEGQVPSYQVSTIRLQDFIESNKIKEIDFLKIDIEGYDLMALEGLDFSKLKPKIIMCEFEDKKTKLLNYTKEDMAHFLKNHDYLLVYSIWFPIKEYGVQHKWKKMSENIEDIDPNDWGNIIAFADQKDYDEFKERHQV